MILQLLTAAIISCPTADTGEFPPLHTLKDNDIVSVNPSFEDKTITIGLKNGTAYIYQWSDWDYEDTYRSTPDRIRKAIWNNTVTFTRTEVPPMFPGGDSAWDGYMRTFCEQHRSEIVDKGPVKITLQFIVHLKGQVNDVQVLPHSPNADSELTGLAIEAIKESPAWVPAFQNGRSVVCYKKQVIKLD